MQVRSLQIDEHERLLELLDGWKLPDGWRGRDFFRRYLDLDPTFHRENVVVVEEAGELIACVQIFPRRLRLQGHSVPCGGIGSVFTRADRRRAGRASALLERAAALMVERGMELSLLFSDRTSFYEKLGWKSWRCQRALVRPIDSDNAHTPRLSEEFERSPFDGASDLEAVEAIHSAYSLSRSGTLVRERSLWEASFRLAGNPDEEFRVARRDGELLAYLRATRLNEVLMVTELGRLDQGAAALAALLVDLLQPRYDDPLATRDKPSSELRTFAVLPAFDDLPLSVELENRGVSSRSVDDRSCMLRCLKAPALAERLEVSLLPGEEGEAFLQRMLPQGSLVSWPADRF